MKIVMAAVIVLGVVSFAFAQMNMTDSVTITTYYPSPYGSYRQLEVRRGLTYRPLPATPAPSKDDREGEMIYVDANPSDTNPGEFYFRGGKKWVPQAGGGETVVTFSCPWVSNWNAGINSGWGNQCGADGSVCCTPQNCPADWTQVGTPYVVLDFALGSGAGIPNGWNYADASHPAAGGRVVRVCIK